MFKNKSLAIYSLVVLCSVFFLIFVGASVTSNQAGLSVPDWPTTYGENMFTFPISKWQGGIFFEHSHRLIASAVGALTVILCIWIWLVEKRKWVKALSVIAVFAVILQGVLGGLTVYFKLPLAISAFHAVLGQTFMCLILAIVYSQLNECLLGEGRLCSRKTFSYLAVVLCGSVYLQLIIGALMRHSEAGLAVPDFPNSGGTLLPTFDDRMFQYVNDMLFAFGKDAVDWSQILIHLLHRFFAFLILICGFIVYQLSKRLNVPAELVKHYLFVITCAVDVGNLCYLEFEISRLNECSCFDRCLAFGFILSFSFKN
jgi:cytochrome c oxidase assembly protein subunit 15